MNCTLTLIKMVGSPISDNLTESGICTYFHRDVNPFFTHIRYIDRILCFVFGNLYHKLNFFSRRWDKQPSSASRVCSCHFKDGKRTNLPEIFEEREKAKVITPELLSKRKKRTCPEKQQGTKQACSGTAH